jgi:hypothetical protein
MKKWLKRIAALIALVIFICAIPILWVETQCIGKLPKSVSAYQPILPPEHRRNLADTYLTYPEWSIVHAYEDFAGVVKQKSESQFRYLESIRGVWNNLCEVAAIADSKGTITTDIKATLYIIGISFAGEMGVKGAYESTIGWLTEWIRGPQRTAEDEFALKVAEDYAKFLQQTPWYEFPFGATLGKFWSEVPLSGGNYIRKIERRIALSMEYGVKAVYAKLIAQAAALAPAALTIRSVIALEDNDVAAVGNIKLIEKRADGSAVIETPRYRAFTNILRALADRGRNFTEIAGNDEIFVTLLAPQAFALKAGTAKQLFSVPVQPRPGWTRRGVSLPVKELAAFMRDMKAQRVEFEHVYDY